MSRQEENEIKFSVKENDKIKNIARQVNSGGRMSPSQLRFSLTTVGVLLVALVLLLIFIGGKATSSHKLTEEITVLRDVMGAERVVPGEKNALSFVEGYAYKGEGTRFIQTKQMSTTKNYWVTLKTDSEITELEGILGEGRFLKIEDLGDKSLWLVMGTEADIKKCGIEDFNQLYHKNSTAWMKGDKAAEEAWNKLSFVRFEELGETRVRMRRGTEDTLKELDMGSKVAGESLVTLRWTSPSWAIG